LGKVLLVEEVAVRDVKDVSAVASCIGTCT
jgi:hypothetical protein